MQERSVHDRRSFHVRLTDKGRDLRDRLNAMHKRHVEMLGQTAITDADLHGVAVTLRRLEQFWIRASDPLQGPGQFAANSTLLAEAATVVSQSIKPNRALRQVATCQKPETPQQSRCGYRARYPGHRLITTVPHRPWAEVSITSPRNLPYMASS
jgi:hypothetical protein